MSYASMGSNILFNLFRRENTLLVAEGLNVFRVPARREMDGRTIRESDIRSCTGCSIIALQREGEQVLNPAPETVLSASDELILIGTLPAEDTFFKRFPT